MEFSRGIDARRKIRTNRSEVKIFRLTKSWSFVTVSLRALVGKALRSKRRILAGRFSDASMNAARPRLRKPTITRLASTSTSSSGFTWRVNASLAKARGSERKKRRESERGRHYVSVYRLTFAARTRLLRHLHVG